MLDFDLNREYRAGEIVIYDYKYFICVLRCKGEYPVSGSKCWKEYKMSDVDNISIPIVLNGEMFTPDEEGLTGTVRNNKLTDLVYNHIKAGGVVRVYLYDADEDDYDMFIPVSYNTYFDDLHNPIVEMFTAGDNEFVVTYNENVEVS